MDRSSPSLSNTFGYNRGEESWGWAWDPSALTWTQGVAVRELHPTQDQAGGEALARQDES